MRVRGGNVTIELKNMMHCETDKDFIMNTHHVTLKQIVKDRVDKSMGIVTLMTETSGQSILQIP